MYFNGQDGFYTNVSLDDNIKICPDIFHHSDLERPKESENAFDGKFIMSNKGSVSVLLTPFTKKSIVS